MERGNKGFWDVVPENVKYNLSEYLIIKRGDARHQPAEDNSVDIQITSSPYVTSYEYADLHQLPSLWFGYLSELAAFRKKFIGSAYKDRERFDLKSSLAEEIVTQLGENKKGREVKNYFADMLETFIEMKRVSKKCGRACIVIGNTQFR